MRAQTLVHAYDTEVDQGGVRDREAPVFLIVSTLLSFNTRWVLRLIVHVQLSVIKSIVFTFPIINMLTFNIVVLTLGPIILVLLVICKRNHTIARQREIGSLPRSRAPHFRYFSLNPQSSDSHHRDYNGVSLALQPRTDRLIAIWAHSKFWIVLVVTLGFVGFFVYRDQPFRESKAFEYS
jgi:hypothetical protein